MSSESSGRPQRSGEIGGRALAASLALLPVVLSFAAQHKVLASEFWRDDFLHLYDIVNDGVLRFVFSPYGGHLYTLRNLIFALTYKAFGLDPAPYFWCVILTHSLNVFLLSAVLRRQTGRPVLAALLATAWGTSPIHTGMLDWYSAYGQTLCATMLLLGMWNFLVGRDQEKRRARWLVALACLLVGANSFGVGATIALVFPLAAALSMPAGRGRKSAMLFFSALLFLVPLMYVVSPFLSKLLGTADTIGDSMNPAFLSAWRSMPKMFGYLVTFGTCTLITGPGAPLVGDGLGLLPAAAFCVIGISLLMSDAEARRQLCAWLLMAAAAYAIIAMGRTFDYISLGQALSSAARVPRYHYIGQMALCGALAVALASFDRFNVSRRMIVRGIFGAGMVVLILVNVRASVNHVSWSSTRGALTRFQQMVEKKANDQPPEKVVCLENGPFESVDIWVTGLRAGRFPGLAGIFLITWNDGRVNGRRVFFIERYPAALKYMYEREGKISSVMLPPGFCPAGEE
jgi:hypothetical protein